jgi:hypothetical protein
MLLGQFPHNHLLDLDALFNFLRIQIDWLRWFSIRVDKNDVFLPRLEQISDDGVVPIFFQCAFRLFYEKAVIGFQLNK